MQPADDIASGRRQERRGPENGSENGPVHGPQTSPIAAAFARQAAARGDDLALWSRGEDLRLTFADLAARVAERRERMADLGVGPDTSVALACGNCAAFVEVYLALRGLGAPVVAMDGALPLDAKIELCKNLGVPRLVARIDGDQLLPDLTTPEPAAVDALTGAFAEGASSAAGSAPGEQPVGLVRVPLDDGATLRLPSAIGLVKLTSGSTGLPVGACFTDACLEVGIRQIADGMSIGADDVVLLAIPLSHSYGFDNGVLSLACVGTPLVLQPSIFPADLLRALGQSGATFLPLVPPLVRSLGQARWPEGLPLRTVICAGGVLRPDAASDFRAAAGVPVRNFYGSTETGGISFETGPDDPEAEGTVGTPLPGVRVEIGDAGRLTIHSAANLVGRLGDEFGETLTPQPVVTGDTGTWTDEGRLRLTGRTADILNIGGRKIAAAEVEEALRGLDDVHDAAVVGVDDPVRGERTVAFVVADQWPVDTGSLPQRLTPREVRPIDALPHTERGKLDRQALRKLARARRSAKRRDE